MEKAVKLLATLWLVPAGYFLLVASGDWLRQLTDLIAGGEAHHAHHLVGLVLGTIFASTGVLLVIGLVEGWKPAAPGSAAFLCLSSFLIISKLPHFLAQSGIPKASMVMGIALAGIVISANTFAATWLVRAAGSAGSGNRQTRSGESRA